MKLQRAIVAKREDWFPSLEKSKPVFSSLLVSRVGERTWWPIQSLKHENSERLRGDRDRIKFIDLIFERGQVVGFSKGRRRQDVP